MKKYNVQIIGGGLAGLSLATCLGKKNISTLLIDALPNPADTESGDRRTTALIETSVDFFKNINVWDAVKEYSYALDNMRMIPINPPNAMGQEIVFSAADVNSQHLAYNTDNHELRKSMCEKISSYNSVNHIFSCQTDNATHTDDGWIISTSFGDFIANLTVGSDGRRSMIRQSANINTKQEDYKQSAIVFNVKHSISHDNTSTEFMYPEGAFTFVPMGHNISSIVWAESTDTVQSYIKDYDLLLRQFEKKSHGKFGTLKIISDIQAFPLNQIMAISSIADKLCLLGEAHHGLTPVAAQGLNLSLRDSAVLAEIIINTHNNGGDVGGNVALKSYSRKRRADVNTRAFGTKIFHKISQRSDPISLILKTIGIGLFNRIPIAKKAVVGTGLSFPGGIPLYMQHGINI